MRYLFWDIDGTLLSTGRAGIIAWERATQDVFGERVDFSELATAGLIDPEIARMISRRVCPAAGEDEMLRLLRRYESHLPSCLPLRQGKVLPNVAEILDHVKALPDLRSQLLTGNTRAGAAAKLGYYGLSQYFEGGAFSDGCAARDEVARCADRIIPAAQRRACELYVIGDTPHDIRCAAAIGARSIAVATGEYGLEELHSHGPWLTLPQLPPPDAFVELID